MLWFLLVSFKPHVTSRFSAVLLVLYKILFVTLAPFFKYCLYIRNESHSCVDTLRTSSASVCTFAWINMNIICSTKCCYVLFYFCFRSFYYCRLRAEKHESRGWYRRVSHVLRFSHSAGKEAQRLHLYRIHTNKQTPTRLSRGGDVSDLRLNSMQLLSAFTIWKLSLVKRLVAESLTEL